MQRLFSQRKGFKPVKVEMQKKSVDEDLRNCLWNICLSLYKKINEDKLQYRFNSRIGEDIFKAYWYNYFKKPLDTLPHSFRDVLNDIRKYFFGCKWFEIYDFIEFTANCYKNKYSEPFIRNCNIILERELSAYRFVNGKISEITSQEEIDSIEEAIKNSNRFKGAQNHLQTALNFLTDRKSPDYRNSIKESISAIESICKTITHSKKGTLGQTLQVIEQKYKIHPALKKVFSSLYGYTNDEEGIRHSLLGESNLTFIDAKYMLVSCSAFINYLIYKIKN